MLQPDTFTLSQVLAASPDLITLVEPGGSRTQPAEAIRATLGYEPAAFAQLDPGSLIHPDDRERLVEAFGSLLKGGPPVDVRFRVRHADGRWVVLESRAQAVTDQEGRPMGAVAVSRDVTQRAALEEELIRARNEAEDANRAKSEFLSRMSHELRTPLNAIMGFGQLLEMEGLDPEHLEYVRHILKGGEHLLDLINEVLDIARIETGRMSLSLEPIGLVEALWEAIDLINPLAAGRGIELKSERSWPTDRQVWADHKRLRQVLLNLLSNAVKYNRPGGAVTVRCIEPSPTVVRIEVTDEGAGIAPELLPRLFVPFDRLGAEGTLVEGTGLGLALSKGLMEAMGGALGVRTDAGRGSTFFVELARSEAPGDGGSAGDELRAVDQVLGPATLDLDERSAMI